MLKRLFSKTRPTSRSHSVAASVPPGTCVFAIGDIHGCQDALALLLDCVLEDAIEAIRKGLEAHLVFLGDYVDRGPDSRGVLDSLTALPETPIHWHFLEGNHEAALMSFLASPLTNASWFDFGGIETLASYGVSVPTGPLSEIHLLTMAEDLDEQLPPRHRRFLENLDLMVELGDYLFVHAGIRPGVPLAAQSRGDLLTIRKPFLGSTTWHGKKIVHGHSVIAEPMIRPERIAIDTGAYRSGRLTCAVLEGGDCHFIVTRTDGQGVERFATR
jgi:serine/threonine protein phosphatase 1